MKKLLPILLALTLLLALPACGTPEEAEFTAPLITPPHLDMPELPSFSPLIPLSEAEEGYSYYDGEEYGIRIKYPETWFELNEQSLSDPDTVATASLQAGMTEEELTALIDEFQLLLVNGYVNGSPFAHAMSFLVTEGPGMVIEDFLHEGTPAMMKELLIPEFEQIF